MSLAAFGADRGFGVYRGAPPFPLMEDQIYRSFHSRGSSSRCSVSNSKSSSGRAGGRASRALPADKNHTNDKDVRAVKLSSTLFFSP